MSDGRRARLASLGVGETRERDAAMIRCAVGACGFLCSEVVGPMSLNISYPVNRSWQGRLYQYIRYIINTTSVDH
jgi:hypothetical protein